MTKKDYEKVVHFIKENIKEKHQEEELEKALVMFNLNDDDIQPYLIKIWDGYGYYLSLYIVYIEKFMHIDELYQGINQAIDQGFSPISFERIDELVKEYMIENNASEEEAYELVTSDLIYTEKGYIYSENLRMIHFNEYEY